MATNEVLPRTPPPQQETVYPGLCLIQRQHEKRARRLGRRAFVPQPGGALAQMLLDVVNRFADRGDLLGVLVADLQLELLFQRHDQLDEIE